MDFLVKLYSLPDAVPSVDGYLIRRAIGPEYGIVIDWIKRQFGHRWASEASASIIGHGLFIALRTNEIVGFACYDGTLRGFFGPMGVDPGHRAKGIGRALLLGTLHAMKNAGYGYAIIGDGIPAYYERQCGAIPIADSWPGIYRDLATDKGGQG